MYEHVFNLLKPMPEALRKTGTRDTSVDVYQLAIQNGNDIFLPWFRTPPIKGGSLKVDLCLPVLITGPVSHEMEVKGAFFRTTIEVPGTFGKWQTLRLFRVTDERGSKTEWGNGELKKTKDPVKAKK